MLIARPTPQLPLTLRRGICVAVVLLAAAAALGATLSTNISPHQEIMPGDVDDSASTEAIDNVEKLSPDLALYRTVTAAVARGENYYTAAAREIPKHGFPVRSTLNFRLPTYAWLFSLFPSEQAIQVLLLLLGLVGIVLTLRDVAESQGPLPAMIAAALQAGALRWGIDGHAYYAQELWAASFIIIALATYAHWPLASIVSLASAAMFRELALPLLPLVLLVTLFRRQYRSAAASAIATTLLVAFYCWHHRQVGAVTMAAASDAKTALDLGQWMAFGGLDFWLLTTRMNSWLIQVPAAIVAIYLVAALAGIADEHQPRAIWMQLFTAAFFLGVLVIGRPENRYWGLIVAPMLSLGVAAFPATIARWWRNAETGTSIAAPQ